MSCRQRGKTTLHQTIQAKPVGISGTVSVYHTLEYGPGEAIVRRFDLINEIEVGNLRHRCKGKKQRYLTGFIQLSDVHIIDADSPGRAQFLQKLSLLPQYTDELSDIFRPQEILTNQVLESMVRKVNQIEVGPVFGKKLSFVINTGDNGDAQQLDELRNYINLLDGDEVVPNPTGKYVGVQDRDTTQANFELFWHPGHNLPPDKYKVQNGFPSYPNLLHSAVQPFRATGLNRPWYAVFGNHDCTLLGNYALIHPDIYRYFNQLSQGDQMITDMTPSDLNLFVDGLRLRKVPPIDMAVQHSTRRTVPASPERHHYTLAEFIAAHLEQSNGPGPGGHGFTDENLKKEIAYYSFHVSSRILGITLDTCNPTGVADIAHADLGSEGSIGHNQLTWLEQELISVHSTYLDRNGQPIKTENRDKLVILFSHHPSWRLLNNASIPEIPPWRQDDPRILGVEFLQFLYRFPNVFLWVNGHTHTINIMPHKNPHLPRLGMWEVNSPSHIDWPQYARTFEIVANPDKTLSIFCVMLDHDGPPNPQEAEDEVGRMASISRELAYNNPAIPPVGRSGTRADRNVELLLLDPRKL
jgi:metallophosphoesterase (TIGR03767 family)